jgi:hypothetical protein
MVHAGTRAVWLDAEQREALRWVLRSAQKTLRNLAGVQVPSGKPSRASIRAILEEVGDA